MGAGRCRGPHVGAGRRASCSPSPRGEAPGGVRGPRGAAELPGRARGPRRPPGRAGAGLRPARPGRRCVRRALAASGDRGADPAPGRARRVARPRQGGARAPRAAGAHPGGARGAGARRAPRRPSISDVVRILGPIGSRMRSRPCRSASSPLLSRRTEAGRTVRRAALGASAVRERGGRRGLAASWRGAPQLRTSGRRARSVAFGELFAGEETVAGPGAIQPSSAAPVRTSVTLPGGVLPVTPEEMPALRAVLDDALAALGAPGVQNLARPRPAPRRHGWPGRTTWSWAPARSRCSGRSTSPSSSRWRSRSATRVRRWRGRERCRASTAAAAEAFAAVPSPSAAARVLLWLDPVARGADLDTVDPAAVLTGSAALAAVVQRALQLV